MGYKILEIKKSGDFGKFLNTFFVRILGVLLPILVFAIYLTQNHIWTEFFDYTLFGIKTFSNNISYFSLFSNPSMIIRILSFMMPVLFVVIFAIYIASTINENLRETEWIEKLQVLLVYSIASLPVIYPIADTEHFAIGTMCAFITGIYLLYNFINHILKSEKLRYIIKIFFKVTTILFAGEFVIYSALLLLNTVNSEELSYEKPLNHLEKIPVESYIYEVVNEVDTYILEKRAEGKTVYILDAMAAMFNIPLDIYNKNYDMFNLGNFGGKGEEGIIEELDHTQNLMVLLLKEDYNQNWQSPQNILKHVKENYEYIEDVGIFDVYVRK